MPGPERSAGRAEWGATLNAGKYYWSPIKAKKPGAEEDGPGPKPKPGPDEGGGGGGGIHYGTGNIFQTINNNQTVHVNGEGNNVNVAAPQQVAGDHNNLGQTQTAGTNANGGNGQHPPGGGGSTPPGGGGGGGSTPPGGGGSTPPGGGGGGGGTPGRPPRKTVPINPPGGNGPGNPPGGNGPGSTPGQPPRKTTPVDPPSAIGPGDTPGNPGPKPASPDPGGGGGKPPRQSIEVEQIPRKTPEYPGPGAPPGKPVTPDNPPPAAVGPGRRTIPLAPGAGKDNAPSPHWGPPNPDDRVPDGQGDGSVPGAGVPAPGSPPSAPSAGPGKRLGQRIGNAAREAGENLKAGLGAVRDDWSDKSDQVGQRVAAVGGAIGVDGKGGGGNGSGPAVESSPAVDSSGGGKRGGDAKAAVKQAAGNVGAGLGAVRDDWSGISDRVGQRVAQVGGAVGMDQGRGSALLGQAGANVQAGAGAMAQDLRDSNNRFGMGLARLGGALGRDRAGRGRGAAGPEAPAAVEEGGPTSRKVNMGNLFRPEPTDPGGLVPEGNGTARKSRVSPSKKPKKVDMPESKSAGPAGVAGGRARPDDFSLFG